MLKFQEKKLFLRLILKYSNFICRQEKGIFTALEVEWPGRKAGSKISI